MLVGHLWTELWCRQFLKGVKAFIWIGTAGIASPDIGVGTIIVPTSAMGDCTVFEYYQNLLNLKNSLLDNGFIPASSSFLDFINKTVKEKQLDKDDFITGRVFSTSLIMHEEEDVVDKYLEMRCIGADMETAPLFAGCTAFGILAVALHIGSDHMRNGQHHSDFPELFQKGVTNLHAILKELIPFVNEWIKNNEN